MARCERFLALARSLRHVQRPGTCPTCIALTGLLLHPVQDLESQLLEDLRDNYPDFWASCIAFLTTPRTMCDLPVLRQQLVENARTCPYCTRDPYLCPRFEDPVYILVHGLYMALLGCLLRGKHPLFAIERSYTAHKARFANRHGRWPDAADQLFPFDEQQCVDMHVFWLSLRFSIAPLNLLNILLLLARPKMLPHITSGSSRASFIYVLAQMLHANVTDRPEGWQGEPPVSPAGDATFPLAQPDYRAELMGVSGGFMDVLACGYDSTTYDHIPFFAGYERTIFHAILAVLRNGEHYRAFPERARPLARFSEYLLYKLDLPLSACDDVLAPCPSAFHPSVTRSIWAIWTHLGLLSKQRCCSSPGCGKTIHDNGDRPFPTCARCKTVRYCGRECQQRDWSSGQYRHKDICRLLCRLLAEARIGMDLNEFAQACERALPDVETEIIPLSQWAMCGGLVHGEEHSALLKNHYKALHNRAEKTGLPLEEVLLEVLQGLKQARNPDEKLAFIRRLTAKWESS